MNCPKCGWPGLIGGALKRQLAASEERERARMEDNADLRARLLAAEMVIMHAANGDWSRSSALLRAYVDGRP